MGRSATMSAHYTPYRNEPDPADQLQWADGGDTSSDGVHLHEAGVRMRRSPTSLFGGRAMGVAAAAFALTVFGAAVGLLMGYLGRVGAGTCPDRSPSLLHTLAREPEALGRLLRERIKADNLREYLRSFSSHPHLAGSLEDAKHADKLADSWRSFRFDKVEKRAYEVLLSSPDADRPNTVLVNDDEGTVHFRSRAWETDNAEFGPAFNAYSPPGTAQGGLVYANYGQPGEFALLTQKMKLNLTGKLIIMRLGMIRSSDQVRIAERHGAVGVILYPDPLDFRMPGEGDSVYPRSRGLPDYGIQWGTVAMAPIGDPLTPGYPATDYAFRIPEDEAETLPKIPVHTLSSGDAALLLSLLGGARAPNAWQGALNITYNIGPEFVQPNWSLHLESNNRNKMATTYNVLGYIRGRIEPDRYVLIGNHRDAWVYGALDPGSGTAVTLELSRIFGELLQEGWRPRRTLIFCSWSGHEFNLIGSTEWVEENMKVLQERAVAYINVDTAVTGNYSLGVAASPLLYRAIFNATKKVINPNPKEARAGRRSVYDTWLHSFPVLHNGSTLFSQAIALRGNYRQELQRASHSSHLKEVMHPRRPRVHQLQLWSDHAPFFFRAGIPSMDMTYLHRTPGVFPLYHSAYDTFHLAETFVDPEFKYHVTVASILAELILDVGESLFVPFNCLDYGQVLRDLTQTLLLNLEVNPQFRKDLSEHKIDLAILDSAVLNYTNSAIYFHMRQEKCDTSNSLAVRQLNDQLVHLERAFLHPEGLPARPLDRHLVLSPSRGHTFGDETFPGITDMLTGAVPSASTKEHWNTFRKHFTLLVQTIQSAADMLASPA